MDAKMDTNQSTKSSIRGQVRKHLELYRMTNDCSYLELVEPFYAGALVLFGTGCALQEENDPQTAILWPKAQDGVIGLHHRSGHLRATPHLISTDSNGYIRSWGELFVSSVSMGRVMTKGPSSFL